MKCLTISLLSHLLFLGLSTSLDAMLFETMAKESSASVLDLHKAVLSGDSMVVEEILVRSSKCIDERNVFGETPLLLAAKHGYQDCVLALIAHGADVKLSDGKGRTVLDFALKLRLLKIIDSLLGGFDFDIAKLLVDELAGRKVDSHKSSRQLLAIECAKQDCCKILQFLIDLEINVQEGDEDLKTLLHHAAINRSINAYKILIANGAQEDQLDKAGKRALDYGSFDFFRAIAVEHIHGHVQRGEMAKLEEWMLDRQSLAKEAFCMIHEKMNVLHRAVLSGNERMLSLVWEYMPRELVNQLDSQANTPFILACKKGFVGAIKLLIAPSNLELHNNERKDALFYALGHRDIAIIDPFLRFCPPAVCENIVQQALLWVASLWPAVSPIQRLWDLATQNHCLGFRAYLSENLRSFFAIQRKSGTTPLHEACAQSNRVLVEMLLSESDINGKDERGRAPIHIAVRGGFYEIVEFLVKQGADIKALDVKKRTALHYGALKGRFDLVEVLIRKPGEQVNLMTDQSNALIEGDTGKKHEIHNVLKQSVILDFWEHMDYGAGIENLSCLLGARISRTKKNISFKSISFDNSVHLYFVWLEGDVGIAFDNLGSAFNLSSVNPSSFIDLKDVDGCTALILAAKKGHKKIVGTLIDNGANMFAADRDGKTALDWIGILGNEKLLLSQLDRNRIANPFNGVVIIDCCPSWGQPICTSMLYQGLSQGLNFKQAFTFTRRPAN